MKQMMEKTPIVNWQFSPFLLAHKTEFNFGKVVDYARGGLMPTLFRGWDSSQGVWLGADTPPKIMAFTATALLMIP